MRVHDAGRCVGRVDSLAFSFVVPLRNDDQSCLSLGDLLIADSFLWGSGTRFYVQSESLYTNGDKKQDGSSFVKEREKIFGARNAFGPLSFFNGLWLTTTHWLRKFVVMTIQLSEVYYQYWFRYDRDDVFYYPKLFVLWSIFKHSRVAVHGSSIPG